MLFAEAGAIAARTRGRLASLAAAQSDVMLLLCTQSGVSASAKAAEVPAC